MKENGQFKIMIIFSFILSIVLVSLVFKFFNFNKNDVFSNKINLPPKKIISFNSRINGDYVVSDQGKLFTISLDLQELYVIDLASGKLLGLIEIQDKFKSANFKIEDDTVYLILDNKYLYIIDSKTLNIQHIYYDNKARYYSEKFFIYEDVIIASDNRSIISVINLKNGEVVVNKKIGLLRDLELEEGVLFYWEAGFNIFALEPKTLSAIWKYVENYDQHVYPNIAFADGKVYFNNIRFTKVFEAKTGKGLDKFQLHATRIKAVDNTLYSYLAGKNISSFSSRGLTFWSTELNIGEIHFLGDYIFTRDSKEQKLIKLNRYNGELIWSTDWSKRGIKKVSEIQRYDILQDRGGGIYLIDKNNGDRIWKFQDVKDSEKVFFINYNDQLFISDGSNKIFVYEINK